MGEFESLEGSGGPESESLRVILDPELPELWHLQSFSDCGIVAMELVLRSHGIHVTEDELMSLFRERFHPDDPLWDGGTRPDERQLILEEHFGLKVETGESSLDAIGAALERGDGVIASVNAGFLWNDINHLGSRFSNHAIQVIGVTRDDDGKIVEVIVNDSGSAEGQAKHYLAEIFDLAWNCSGHTANIVSAPDGGKA